MAAWMDGGVDGQTDSVSVFGCLQCTTKPTYSKAYSLE